MAGEIGVGSCAEFVKIQALSLAFAGYTHG
jgi:hypothetical protein